MGKGSLREVVLVSEVKITGKGPNPFFLGGSFLGGSTVDSRYHIANDPAPASPHHSKK